MSTLLTYFFARNHGSEIATVSFSCVFLSNWNCLSVNLATSFFGKFPNLGSRELVHFWILDRESGNAASYDLLPSTKADAF